MNFVVKLFALLLLVINCSTVKAAHSIKPQEIKYLRDYRKPDFIVSKIDVTIELDDLGALVTNKALLHNPLHLAVSILSLTGECRIRHTHLSKFI